MDPDAALDELLGFVNLMAGLAESGGERIDCREVLRAVELVEALDSWLTTGGYLPRRWQPASRRTASVCAPGRPPAGRARRRPGGDFVS